MNAAITSELFNNSRQFWSIHDQLYSLNTKVQPHNLKIVLSHMNMDYNHISNAQRDGAIKRVEKDIHVGKLFGVDSTPSLFLCYPNGDVYRIYSLGQLDDIIR